MKKFLAMVLALAMMLSMCVIVNAEVTSYTLYAGGVDADMS